MQADFAVLADSKEFLLFGAVNADVFLLDENKDLIQEFKKLVARYKLLLVSENLFELLNEDIKEYESKTYPIILCLPETKRSNNFALKNLVKKAKNSLGLDIFKENL